jgi:hypothetical protein
MPAAAVVAVAAPAIVVAPDTLACDIRTGDAVCACSSGVATE